MSQTNGTTKTEKQTVYVHDNELAVWATPWEDGYGEPVADDQGQDEWAYIAEAVSALEASGYNVVVVEKAW